MSIQGDVEKKLIKHSDHILSVLKNKNDSNYYSSFIHMINYMESCGILSERKRIKDLLDKLLISRNGKFDSNQYLQGISEIIFWVYAQKKGYVFEQDFNVNSDNHSDVDIRVSTKLGTYNIEIKCPDQKDYSSEFLYLYNAYRVPGISKEVSQNDMQQLIDMIQPGIDSHPEMGKKGSVIVKTEDNKIIDYMKSAQKKFSYSDKEINILVISLPSSDMQKYFGYLKNPYSGILCDNLELFGRKTDEFDKIDVVMLANIVSGHDKEVDIDVWNLEQYCLVGFLNPYSKGIQYHTKPILCMIEDFPDRNIDFTTEFNEKLNSCNSKEIPIFETFFYEYLVNHFSELYHPDEKRTMWFRNGRVNGDLLVQ